VAFAVSAKEIWIFFYTIHLNMKIQRLKMAQTVAKKEDDIIYEQRLNLFGTF
jgi:hypothetical protein